MGLWPWPIGLCAKWGWTGTAPYWGRTQWYAKPDLFVSDLCMTIFHLFAFSFLLTVHWIPPRIIRKPRKMFSKMMSQRNRPLKSLYLKLPYLHSWTRRPDLSCKNSFFEVCIYCATSSTVLSANYACMLIQNIQCLWQIVSSIGQFLSLSRFYYFFSNEVLIEVGKLLILYITDLALGYQYINSSCSAGTAFLFLVSGFFIYFWLDRG